MSKKASSILILAIAGAFPVAVVADEVILKNGDRITGEVIKLEAGRLTIRTPYAGNVNIKWEDANTLSTDEPVSVRVDGESRIQARIRAAEPGTATLEVGDWLASEPIALSRFGAMTRKPEPPVRLTGRINVGASSASGNTNTERLHANTEVVARSVKNRFTIGGVVNRAKDGGVETESNSRGYMKYDHFINTKWYAYSNADFERDKFKDIRMRTTIGAGTGYQFLETPRTNFSVEAGATYVNTDFELQEDENYPAARWASNFDHFLFGSPAQFFHRHEVIYDLEDNDQLFVRTQTGVRFPIVARLNATAQYNMDWEDNPAPGRTSTDRMWMLTLGYSW
jgi:putative salt-induced outer membrane protein YdiY